MLHHLPRKPRQQCASEIRRVLKPGGRVLAVDFAGEPAKRHGCPNIFMAAMAAWLRKTLACACDHPLNSDQPRMNWPSGLGLSDAGQLAGSTKSPAATRARNCSEA